MEEFLKSAGLREHNYEKASICKYKPYPNIRRRD
jgi:hypothetical protein